MIKRSKPQIRSLRAQLTIAATVLLAGANAQAGSLGPNLITNGTFNTAPTVGLSSGGSTTSGSSTELGTFSFSGSSYTSTLNGWSVSGSNPYVLWYTAANATTQTAFSQYDSCSSGCGTAAPVYTGSEVFRATPGADPNGNLPNFVALDGDPGVRGTLTQTLTGLTIGTVYQLTFDYAAAQLVTGNGTFSDNIFYNLGSSATINTATGAFVQAKNSSGSTTIAQGGTAPWATMTAYFEATSTTQYLSFLAVGGSGQPPIALLDNVALYAAPEPSTLALGGTAMLAFLGVLRRRRRLASV